ncbi:uncharacterized protein LOC126964417 isoform X3 [Leptidea sinapis]|uniref:uncharacterized protein LOC126964417 isoform X3 n=1 Tax=Leptidea sinapis TaxID=189913 RepID=UPI00213A89C8|nr:uncharacterized protein LOC126964417 isoform X3 [Leptidea sinapis]
MLFNHLMEGGTVATNTILPFKSLDGKDEREGTIKALLKNFTVPEPESMAIKQNRYNDCVYTVPIKPPMSSVLQRQTVQEAKQAFLNTSNHTRLNKEEPILHYAQIAITTQSEDMRSTGGGKFKEINTRKPVEKSQPIEIPNIKKKVDQQRKVSFKIKNASASYRRPPIVTTMTLTGSKVSELTKKFNDLVNAGAPASSKQSKLVKSIEEQLVTRYSASNSSTPSSTLSSSPNIKILVRHRKGSKKKNNRKRCSSMDSIDKLSISENSISKIRIIRSKSDGNKIPKSPKKRLKYPDSSEQQSGSDSVDGSPDKKKNNNSPILCDPPTDKVVVKNVIKKFECEIIAQSQQSTIKRQPSQCASNKINPMREKPKVPEKKTSLVVTKNLVLKDGVPKIKIIKPVLVDVAAKDENTTIQTNIIKKKEPLYDKKKFKTNYIHSEKLPLHVVEIIQEEGIEHYTPLANNDTISEEDISKDSNKIYQDLESQVTPNESFLWRRKSSQLYSESEMISSENPYGLVNVTIDKNTTIISCNENCPSLENTSTSVDSRIDDESQKTSNETNCESQSSDFESNLIEACNKDVIVGFTSKPPKPEVEDDYETLEPRDDENIVVVAVKSERTSKINCPLPEIPKSENESRPVGNIYQCLLEMRSHPEGDESSLHSYETCGVLEERTRGDGDSDDGYEYCKSPIKPYCLTSSAGIQIAEDYKPSAKNYVITKSVSGTSTVSYEKIGSDRIYEKIPYHPEIYKESSPSQSKRHSLASDNTSYNDNENIYDTIKHVEGTLSHCYESIPNSPNVVKLRNKMRKLPSAVQKRLSFDNVSNLSESTLSSEQKTNSIYGQRSVVSYNGQEIVFQVPSSETSVSDRSERSDRSDDWVDISDEEKAEEKKIIIVQERSRGRKSPLGWSQKVRHQWQHSPKRREDKECDSSESGHLYESLEPVPPPPALSSLPMRPCPPIPASVPTAVPALIDDDFDSFDSDSDYDDNDKTLSPQPPALPASRLPTPPNASGQYTLTKIANAAQKKMRQIKRNLTKRYSAMDGKTFIKSSNQNGTYDVPKNQTKTKSPTYANYEKPENQNVYSNINFETKPNKTENSLAKITGSFKDELKTVIGEKKEKSGEKRLSTGEKRLSGEIPPPLPEKSHPEKPTTPNEMKKDGGTLSRKAYLSFKSRFRRATSMAVDINSEIPSALKITNSTFYLTDSMDGDSGFSNCSDSGATPSDAASPRREELKRLLPTLSRKDKAPRTRTSWYAECLTDAGTTSNSAWYAEAGTYPAGNISSSSGASSASHPASPLPHSLFTHEPLYQFYNAAKVESVCRGGDSDSDAYEAGGGGSTQSCPQSCPPRPSAMALVAPRGPARTLWCEVPEVLNSAVLSSLAPAQKKLQEAKFELLTSEASYLNSLNVLETHFISHPAFRDPNILSPQDWETLFSTILPVHKCSKLLLADIEKCWQENILLAGICDIVRSHAEQRFHVYVKYCENQALMVRTLQRLRENSNFAAALKRLESEPACQSLSLHSFLLLPMQRVTRLPLLMDALLRNLAPADQEYEACVRALTTLNHFVSQCNEGARNTERVEEMLRLSSQIQFPPHLRSTPDLAPACCRRTRRPVRWLVRSGEMTQMVWKTDELKLTFGKKFHKVPLHLFLFNDHLVITKKKSEQCYVCVEHCARSLVDVCASDAPAAAKHGLLLTLLENHEGRTVEMLMSCASETDSRRWVEALSPPSAAEAGEAVYAGWDCPQVAALYEYVPAQPDELRLTEGDVVNVTRKTSEGWFYGERTRDGEAGWFPGSYTAEIASPHVRARNLRQRYRLLALSATYLGQKRPL